MFNDLRQAFRSLLKSPGYTIVALVTLALGIGVNTSMFSLVDALLFQPAPFPNAHEIYSIVSETKHGEHQRYSQIEEQEIREKTTAFTALMAMAYDYSALALTGRPAEQVHGILATAELFDVVGIQPMLGRAFTVEETMPGKNQVIILSKRFWMQYYGGDRNVLGKVMRLEGENLTIIGVMPEVVDYPMLWETSTYWRPLNYTPDQLSSRTHRPFKLIGRLKPGATPEQASAELASLAISQQTDFPKDYSGLTYRVIPVHEATMDDEGRSLIWMLLSLSGFVLLIACANLANLQLARATSSIRDFAIRAALGASRYRLIMHQLTESIMLSLIGGGLGILIAMWINSALSASILINNQSGALNMPINGTVLLMTMTAALLAGLIFGIVPAVLASRTDVVTALKSSSRGSTSSRSHHRLRQILIVAEVALALVLLGGAGVMQRGFDKFIHRNSGWDTSKVLTGTFPMPAKSYPNPEARIAFYRKIEARISALPGVESVSLSSALPLHNFGNERRILTEKQTSADRSNLPFASQVVITADFFKTLGIKILEGQTFSLDIKPDGPTIMIVNDALARQYWPNQSAVGQRLAMIVDDELVWGEVIGVVSTAESVASFGEPRTPYQIFRPLVHDPRSWVSVAVRSQSPAALIESVRRAVTEVDPDLPADDLLTVSQYVDRSQHNLVVVANLLTGFALLGLVLASVGIYGVISNLVAQRTGEFGIRQALGAKPSEILSLVLYHGITLCVLGVVLGLGGAYGLSRVLNSIMPRMVSPDAIALGSMAIVLFVVAFLACYIPARRATKVNPIEALRVE